MKNIKILGSGCKNCEKTVHLIQSKADELGIKVNIEKVTEISDIMSYGVMSTPGVVLDDAVVHAGGVPSSDQIAVWLS